MTRVRCLLLQSERSCNRLSPRWTDAQGGLKLLPRVLRVHGTHAGVLAACGRVLGRCTAASAANQQALAKEKVLI
jgi:hypothetical protein